MEGSGGTLVISASNTYTGVTIVGSGVTLALTGSGSIAASMGVEADGTFDISQTTSGTTIKTLASMAPAASRWDQYADNQQRTNFGG